eukprot:COSAG05_NODE_3887_length_1789_cov_1.429586_1_plen_187_part_00
MISKVEQFAGYSAFTRPKPTDSPSVSPIRGGGEGAASYVPVSSPSGQKFEFAGQEFPIEMKGALLRGRSGAVLSIGGLDTAEQQEKLANSKDSRRRGRSSAVLAGDLGSDAQEQVRMLPIAIWDLLLWKAVSSVSTAKDRGLMLFDWHSYRESRSNSAAEVSDLDGLFQAVQCHGQRVHGSRKVWI